MTAELLARHFVEKPWGRTDLPAAFAADGRRIGEVWYDRAGVQLPLLVKWLFTSEKLSIQCHPNDEQARARGLPSGKEECWIVTAAESDARIGMGTLRDLSDDELREASLSGEIEDLMDWKPVQSGDWFYIPAGTVHAIGAGVTLVEIQQNADITYRLYDYGRPRELHLDEGVATANARPYLDPRQGRLSDDCMTQLVDGPHFSMWHGRGSSLAGAGLDGAAWIVPLSGHVGNATVGDVLYADSPGEVTCSDDARWLLATDVSQM